MDRELVGKEAICDSHVDYIDSVEEDGVGGSRLVPTLHRQTQQATEHFIHTLIFMESVSPDIRGQKLFLTVAS